MSGCDCFDETLKSVEEKLRSSNYSKIPEGATDVSVEWKDKAFFFSGDYVPVNPKIAFSFRGKKKDGSPNARLNKGEVGVMCSYCPFCGRKLNKDGGSENAD